MGGDARGLEVVFDGAADGRVWPGPLSGSAACEGVLWLGPLGLLGRLETELGLGGLVATELERAAMLAERLETTPGYWSASLEAARLATARRLLRDRDLLCAWGWRGEPASARLEALWQVCEELPPGIAERADAVVAALRTRTTSIARLHLATPREELEPTWAQLVAAIEGSGSEVSALDLVPAKARGDVEAARGSTFRPAGDGSLVLFRPHGPLAAADEVAGALAAMDDRREVVVIGGDALLDAALRRHGLPGTGCDDAPASAALPRLVLSCGFEPTEPADIHALLCAQPGPIPRGIAASLIRALRRFPGRGSAAWREALESGVAKLEPERRPGVRERIDALVMPARAGAQELEPADIDARMTALATWARGRVGGVPSLSAAIEAAAQLRSLVAASGRARFTRSELAQLDSELGLPTVAIAQAQAGLAAVDAPAGLLGPARTIVWWGFDRDAAPQPARLRLGPAERETLANLGVAPPDIGARMEREARRWRRPLEQAREHLLLVSPLTDRAGAPNHPHPLWDELCAAMGDRQDPLRLVADVVEAPAAAVRERAMRRSTPRVVGALDIDEPVRLRGEESPSSLERLLGCSFSYAVHYPARLRPGLSAPPPPPSPLLYGTLAHHALEHVFASGALPPSDAEARAVAFVDGELERMCETLRLPRYQSERGVLRRAIIESAREIARVVEAAGARVRGVELSGTSEQDGYRLAGRADLVLADPPAVIDLKWGKSSHVDKLQSGAAIQLAAYAEMFREGGETPHVGYFTLNHRQLYVDSGCTLDGTALGPGADATWRALSRHVVARAAELAAGRLRAPGNDPEPPRKNHLDDDGTLSTVPPCRYCDFGLLCGLEVS